MTDMHMAAAHAVGNSLSSSLPEHHTAIFYKKYGDIDKMKVGFSLLWYVLLCMIVVYVHLLIGGILFRLPSFPCRSWFYQLMFSLGEFGSF
jgi:hypothetical protein